MSSIFSEPKSRAMRTHNLFSWLSELVLLIMLFTPISFQTFSPNDISLLMFLNGSFGIVMLWIAMADAPYSLKQVHWIFYITFFAIAPLYQYTKGSYPWGYIPTDDSVRIACILVFFWGAIFALASGRSRLVSQDKDKANASWLSEKLYFELTPLARFILPTGCILSLVILVAAMGFNGLFLRTTATVDFDSTSLSLIVTVCPRAFVFGSFALLLLNARREKKHYSSAIIAGICLVLTCFPTALARFNIASIYLGLAVLIFPSFSTKRGLFAFFLILGFLVAYPLFDAFKYIGEAASPDDAILTIANSLTSGYTSGNYDAFSILFWCSDYIDFYGPTYGKQLLGTLLFFVPRTIWPDKPIPSGELVFKTFGRSFTDIAFPLPAEGWINFGIAGLLLFSLAYGVVVSKLDGAYWESRKSKARCLPTVILLFYPFLLCLTFYMLRGAMMTTFTFIIGDFAVMVLLRHFATFLNRHSSSTNLKKTNDLTSMEG